MPIVIQIVGYKNTGKTTLIERVTAVLIGKGYKVGTVKHDAHQFEMDQPGTDTWRHRQAGAQIIAITSAGQTIVMREGYTPLHELLGQMAMMDIVLVEGFKNENYPKIVMIRSEQDFELVRRLHRVAAVAVWRLGSNADTGTDTNPGSNYGVPAFQADDSKSIAAWILRKLL